MYVIMYIIIMAGMFVYKCYFTSINKQGVSCIEKKIFFIIICRRIYCFHVYIEYTKIPSTISLPMSYCINFDNHSKGGLKVNHVSR